MNQHFDKRNNENADEIEKSLSSVSLVTPTEEYSQIPNKLETNAAGQGWRYWKWVTAGALACSVVVLTTTISDVPYSDSTTENQFEIVATNDSESQLLSNQSILAGSIANEPRYVTEEHFVELSNPIDMSDSTTTEVVAFFWYPCWPCSEFEEYLTNWESELGNDVTLTRMPAIWSPAMRFHARAYFTALELGVLDQSHRQFYVAFKKDNPTVSNEEELQQFFANIGISAAEFLSAYNSETTMGLLQHAEQQNRAYQIQSTPSMFVAGKYGISPQGAGGFQEMLDVTDFLIEGI